VQEGRFLVAYLPQDKFEDFLRHTKLKANTPKTVIDKGAFRKILQKVKSDGYSKEWPHVFAKLPFDHTLFLDRFDANHCHAVYGDHVGDLKMICKMLDIEAEVLEA